MAKEKRKAFDAACDYLSRSERSRFEVEKKLKEKEYDEEEIAQAVEKLLELGFLDDHGFAARYAEFAIGKGRGLYRIKTELRQKGISAFDIEDVLYELEEAGIIGPDIQRQRALEIAQGVAEGREPDEKLIGKISRKLASLGYDSSDIHFAIGQIRRG